jgi:hypothetical protein
MPTTKLLFDSATSTPVPGARALVGGERVLLYGVGDVSIDMMIFESPGGLSVIHGQVLAARGEGVGLRARIRLGDDGDAVDTDHFGQFALSTMGALDAEVLHAQSADMVAACTLPTAPLLEVLS